jgi:histone H3/H4
MLRLGANRARPSARRPAERWAPPCADHCLSMAGQSRAQAAPPSADGARRAPARLDATTVRVIAQTVSSAVGGGGVRDDVAVALAVDAEHALRAVVARAKVFMAHARRDTLSADDVAAALSARGGVPTPAGAAVAAPGSVHHARGYVVRAGGTRQPGFEAVGGAPGLFVVPDAMVPLTSAVHAPLPPPPPPPEVRSEWLAFNGSAVAPSGGASPPADRRCPPGHPRDAGPSHVAKRPRTLTRELDAVLHRATAVLSGVTDDAALGSAELHDLLALLSSTPAVHPLLPMLLSHVHALVAANAHAAGCTPRLAAAARALRALANNPHFGFESYVHSALPPLLTTIAGRALGAGDQRALRAVAADVLRDITAMYGTPVLVARATKTLLAVLTGDASELRAVHGAVLGLTALGPEVVRVALLPHVPALVDALRRVADAIGDAEAANAEGEATDGGCGGSGRRSPGAAVVANICGDAGAVAGAVLAACDLCGGDAGRGAAGDADGPSRRGPTAPLASLCL